MRVAQQRLVEIADAPVKDARAGGNRHLRPVQIAT